MCARWWIRFIVVACARRIAGGIDESFPSTNSFVGQSFGQHDQRSKEEMALHAESERLWPVHGNNWRRRFWRPTSHPSPRFLRNGRVSPSATDMRIRRSSGKCRASKREALVRETQETEGKVASARQSQIRITGGILALVALSIGLWMSQSPSFTGSGDSEFAASFFRKLILRDCRTSRWYWRTRKRWKEGRQRSRMTTPIRLEIRLDRDREKGRLRQGAVQAIGSPHHREAF